MGAYVGPDWSESGRPEMPRRRLYRYGSADYEGGQPGAPGAGYDERLRRDDEYGRFRDAGYNPIGPPGSITMPPQPFRQPQFDQYGEEIRGAAGGGLTTKLFPGMAPPNQPMAPSWTRVLAPGAGGAGGAGGGFVYTNPNPIPQVPQAVTTPLPMQTGNIPVPGAPGGMTVQGAARQPQPAPAPTPIRPLSGPGTPGYVPIPTPAPQPPRARPATEQVNQGGGMQPEQPQTANFGASATPPRARPAFGDITPQGVSTTPRRRYRMGAGFGGGQFT